MNIMLLDRLTFCVCQNGETRAFNAKVEVRAGHKHNTGCIRSDVAYRKGRAQQKKKISQIIEGRMDTRQRTRNGVHKGCMSINVG